MCVSFLSVSVSSILQPVYEEWLRVHVKQLSTSSIDSPKDFGRRFSHSKCDGLIFGFKSNYLDAYEYLIILAEASANPTGYYDLALKRKIEMSQDINDNLQRAQLYQELSEQIKKLCLLYPLITIPYKKLFIRHSIQAPGLGQIPLNDYDLGKVL